MAKVGILALSDVSNDSRPKRVIAKLEDKGLKYFITNFNLKKHPSLMSKTVKALKLGTTWVLFNVNINKKIQARKFISYLYNIEDFDHAKIRQAHLLIVFDLDLLVFLTNLAPNTRVLLDLRELYPKQYAGNFAFKIGLRKIRSYLLKNHVMNICTELTSVSKGMQTYYLQKFGLQSSVVRSVSNFQSHKSSDGISTKVKVVYMGIANPMRQLEKAIEIFSKYSDRYDFHLYLVGDSGYIQYLINKYQESGNIFFEKAVPQDEIHSTLIKFDIGWTFYELTTANFEVALPNKFFDYMQAGLAVLGAPTQDMIQQTTQFNFGLFPDNPTFASASELIAKLTEPEIIFAKSEARNASRTINFESESVPLIETIERLLDE
jgi:glycosyltransferase involved in cell wall biosynthesis